MRGCLLIAACAAALMGCHNERGVPGQDDRVQTGSGRPAFTPNKQMTISNSASQSSVPREGGNLDRGATLEDNPAKYNPLPGAKDKPK